MPIKVSAGDLVLCRCPGCKRGHPKDGGRWIPQSTKDMHYKVQRDAETPMPDDPAYLLPSYLQEIALRPSVPKTRRSKRKLADTASSLPAESRQARPRLDDDSPPSGPSMTARTPSPPAFPQPTPPPISPAFPTAAAQHPRSLSLPIYAGSSSQQDPPHQGSGLPSPSIFESDDSSSDEEGDGSAGGDEDGTGGEAVAEEEVLCFLAETLKARDLGEVGADYGYEDGDSLLFPSATQPLPPPIETLTQDQLRYIVAKGNYFQFEESPLACYLSDMEAGTWTGAVEPNADVATSKTSTVDDWSSLSAQQRLDRKAERTFHFRQPLSPLPSDPRPPDPPPPGPDGEPEEQVDNFLFGRGDHWVFRWYTMHRDQGSTERTIDADRALLAERDPPVVIPTRFVCNSRLCAATRVQPWTYDCCRNYCVNYGAVVYRDLDECPNCGADRYHDAIPGIARKPFATWRYCSFLSLLQHYFGSRKMRRSMTHLRRMADAIAASRVGIEEEDFSYNDWMSGASFAALEAAGLLDDARDLVLGFSWDAAVLQNKAKGEAWFCYLQIYNIPPHLRYLRDNMIEIANLPATPYDMDSFMEPIHLDRVELEVGIRTWDVLREEYFEMKGLFVTLGADLVARAKAFGSVGHTRRFGCMKCCIESCTPVAGSGTYYPCHQRPLQNPELRDTEVYSTVHGTPDFPPLRNNHDHLRHAARSDLARQEGLMAYRAATLRTGITGSSQWQGGPGFNVRTFYVIDYMHLYFANVAPLFFGLLLGRNEAFRRVPGNVQPWDFILSEAAIAQMNAEIQAFGDNMPTSFGRRVPTFEQFTSFKTKDWANITLLISIELLRPHVSPELLAMWSLFVRATKLSLQSTITHRETLQIDELFSSFIQEWERIMYQGGRDRSMVVLCRMCIHYLVHVGQEIRDNGPLIGYSQYFTERGIGLQKGLIKSQSHPFANLAESGIRRKVTMVVKLYTPAPPFVDPGATMRYVVNNDGPEFLHPRGAKSKSLPAAQVHAICVLLEARGVVLPVLAEGQQREIKGRTWGRFRQRGQMTRSMGYETGKKGWRSARFCLVSEDDPSPAFFVEVHLFLEVKVNRQPYMLVYGRKLLPAPELAGANPENVLDDEMADGLRRVALQGEGEENFGVWDALDIKAKASAFFCRRGEREICYMGLPSRGMTDQPDVGEEDGVFQGREDDDLQFPPNDDFDIDDD